MRTQTSRRIEKQKEYVSKKTVENILKVLFFKTEKTDILNFKTVHSSNESSFRQESADSLNMVANSEHLEYHKKANKCQRRRRLMQLGN